MSTLHAPRLDVLENSPLWHNASPFLKRYIVEYGLRRVADIGGGANPLLGESFIREHQLDYTLLDISQAELAKAPENYHKIQVDLTAPPSEFRERIGDQTFDLIFSHMFLEHVKDPLRTHGNIHSALRPGGLAIHMYPTPNSLPLALNRVLPEKLTSGLLSLAQPTRDLKRTQSKFPAYYAMCGAPNKRLHAQFRELGFDVLQHTGYIGHKYYQRIPVLRNVESALRPVLVKAGIPLTTFAVLVLQRRTS